MGAITVYSKPNCGGCVLVKSWLQDNGKEFKEIDVTKNKGALKYIKEKGFKGLPVVEQGSLMFSGYNEDKLLDLMGK